MVIRLAERGAEPERLEQQSASLRRELLELDVDDVAWCGGRCRAGGVARVDLVALGELLVSMQGSFEILKPVIESVASVGGPRPGEKDRTAELTVGDKAIKLTGISLISRIG